MLIEPTQSVLEQLPNEIISSNIFSYFRYYYEILALALVSTAFMRMIQETWMQPIPGTEKIFWPIELLSDSFKNGNYTEELKSNLKRLMRKFFNQFMHTEMNPIDRVELYRLGRAFENETRFTRFMAPIHFPYFKHLLSTYFSISKSTVQLSDFDYYEYITPLNSYDMEWLPFKIISLIESGALRKLTFNESDANEMQLCAHGTFSKVTITKPMKMNFALLALLISDKEDLPDLMAQMKERFPEKTVDNLLVRAARMLLVESTKFETVQELLGSVRLQMSDIQVLITTAVYTDYRVEELLCCIFSESAVDEAKQKIEELQNGPCRLDPEMAFIVLSLVAKPSVDLEICIAKSLVESAQDLHLLLLAYIQGFSVSFIRQVWSHSVELRGLGDPECNLYPLGVYRIPPSWFIDSQALPSKLSKREFSGHGEVELAVDLFSGSLQSLTILADIMSGIYPDDFLAKVLQQLKTRFPSMPYNLMALPFWEARCIETLRMMGKADKKLLATLYSMYPGLEAELDHALCL